MKPVVVERHLGVRDFAVLAGCLIVFLGAGFGVFVRRLPAPIGDGTLSGAIAVMIVLCGGNAAAVVAFLIVPPTGRIELREDGLDYDRGQRFVPWSALAAFDDGSLDFVVVIDRDGTRLPAIPTQSEEVRRSVLAVLETRLPRR